MHAAAVLGQQMTQQDSRMQANMRLKLHAHTAAAAPPSPCGIRLLACVAARLRVNSAIDNSCHAYDHTYIMIMITCTMESVLGVQMLIAGFGHATHGQAGLAGSSLSYYLFPHSCTL